jgi:excisionase family DNA binding protein
MSERLLTAREVAEQLGVSAGALLRWTRAGQVPAVKLPSGAIRYAPERIDAWLRERELGAAEREVSPTHADRAQRRGYASVPLRSSPTRSSGNPTGKNEEEDHAC